MRTKLISLFEDERRLSQTSIPSFLRSLILLNVLFFFVFQAGLVEAEAAKVQVQITVIQASNEGTEVDPRLEDLQRQLAAFSFTSYKLLDLQSKSLAFGSSANINLPGERILVISPQGRDSENRLRLRLKIDDLIDTTYTIAEGASIIIGGPRHGKGHLILAVKQTATD